MNSEKKPLSEVEKSYNRSITEAADELARQINKEALLAGATIMAGDGGYQVASLKSPQFLESQKQYEALYERHAISDNKPIH